MGLVRARSPPSPGPAPLPPGTHTQPRPWPPPHTPRPAGLDDLQRPPGWLDTSKDLARASEADDFSELRELGWDDENFVQVRGRGWGL
jgi:hypothetical protein